MSTERCEPHFALGLLLANCVGDTGLGTDRVVRGWEVCIDANR